jgi:hypothetical protein
MTNNTKVIFFTLLPDDYHGWPMVGEFSDTALDAPDEEDVYSAWSDAGYNAYDFDNDDDEDTDVDEIADKKRRVFHEWGNSEIYYATYLAITNDPEGFEKGVENIIGDISVQGEAEFVNFDPEEICEKIKDEFPGSVVIALRA